MNDKLTTFTPDLELLLAIHANSINYDGAVTQMNEKLNSGLSVIHNKRHGVVSIGKDDVDSVAFKIDSTDSLDWLIHALIKVRDQYKGQE
jgi:hypothetical protein